MCSKKSEIEINKLCKKFKEDMSYKDIDIDENFNKEISETFGDKMDKKPNRMKKMLKNIFRLIYNNSKNRSQ